MCGVCGFFGLTNSARSATLLNAMAGSLRHRGPDATGIWLDEKNSVGLATTRLAIIDIPGGKQPMVSADGTHILAFNGEIYNFHLLREQLQSLGHKFFTRSDTEVVLNAARQWGTDCLPRLSGMFAFALYDSQNRTLLLARDKAGIKPLYYHQGPTSFLFGSELKAVLTDPEVPRQINHTALADYLVLGYPLLPATFFKHCQELAPGTWLQVSPRGIRTGTYWSWQRKPSTNVCRDLDYIETVLAAAVGEHLCADVEVGAFLSGGIDSSLLVSIIANHFNKTVRTFTVRFGDQSYDESCDARMVAQRLGTVHHEIDVGDGAVDFSVAENVLDQFDQPFGDSSAIPSYLLSREVRKYVKVVLAGDGGDEMFGGYRRFRYADIAQALGRGPCWLFPAAESACGGLSRVFPTQARQVRKLFRAASLRGGGRLLALASYVPVAELSSILVPEMLRRLGSYRPTFAAADDPGGSDLVDCTIAAALPGDYLRKVDMMSSAHSLEVRVPFLADQVLDLAAQLPRELKFSWRNGKIALRRLAGKHLPPPISRKKKHGFGIPLDSWLGPVGRSEVVDLLGLRSARIRNYVNSSYLEPVLKSFLSGQWNHAMMSRESLFQRVYFLWSLERWLQTWRPAD
jgi:asparagine synthase (glutamine-hydrolysing)